MTDDIRRLAYRVERYLRLEATERLTMVTTFVCCGRSFGHQRHLLPEHGYGEGLDPADGERDVELLYRGWLSGAADRAGILAEEASD